MHPSMRWYAYALHIITTILQVHTMKKLSSFLLLMSIAFSAFGQIEWVFNEGNNDEPYQLIKTMKNQFVALNGLGYAADRITVLDSLGEVVFSQQAYSYSWPYNNVHNFYKVVEMPDSTFAILANRSTNDEYGWGLAFNSIMKFDHEGNFVSELFFAGDDFEVLPDGSFVTTGYPGLIRIDELMYGSGELWGRSLGNNTVVSLAIKENAHILASTTAGLYVLDTAGTIIGQYPTIRLKKMKTDNQNRVVGIRDSSLVILSPDYQIATSVSYSGEGVKDYSINDSMIAVLTMSSHVYIYDENLVPLQDFQLFNQGSFDFITLNGQTIVLAGVERFGINNTHTTFIKEYALNGYDYGLSSDIGIVQIDTPQQTIIALYYGSNYAQCTGNNISIKNFGDKPVDRFFLNVFRGGRYLINQNLQAGEIVEIMIDTILIRANAPDVDSVRICVWSSHPNSRMDLNADNDLSCIQTIVSSKNITTTTNISLYPNPTSDHLHIQIETVAPIRHAHCKIINISGQIVHDVGLGDRQAALSISVANWPSGLYFAQLYSEQGLSLPIKFVVE
jgi:hypothetical protein